MKYSLVVSFDLRCQSGIFMLITVLYTLVPCPSLTDPNNGIITCSLGDDGAPSYEDTCNFTCNTDYELTGSDNRTCQSDGSWSGNVTMCKKGEFILLLLETKYNSVL